MLLEKSIVLYGMYIVFHTHWIQSTLVSNQLKAIYPSIYFLYFLTYWDAGKSEAKDASIHIDKYIVTLWAIQKSPVHHALHTNFIDIYVQKCDFYKDLLLQTMQIIFVKCKIQ